MMSAPGAEVNRSARLASYWQRRIDTETRPARRVPARWGEPTQRISLLDYYRSLCNLLAPVPDDGDGHRR
ncbi:hypothetical protein GFS60_06386 (plasmid) [Rhodococcus sp. WAY2]|nr:hypothetical protein GFS60_06386 [Rhodococcus sp. WAY2]